MIREPSFLEFRVSAVIGLTENLSFVSYDLSSLVFKYALFCCSGRFRELVDNMFMFCFGAMLNVTLKSFKIIVFKTFSLGVG